MFHMIIDINLSKKKRKEKKKLVPIMVGTADKEMKGDDSQLQRGKSLMGPL